MKFFIVYVTFKSDHTEEYYIKGKSMDCLLELIEKYSDGWIITSKESFCTNKALSVFVREIDLNLFPSLSLTRKDFSIINETKSYNISDLK